MQSTLAIRLSNQSSVLNRASKNLYDRQSLKNNGQLCKASNMPVKDLIWDLLNNGLDLTYFDSKAGHHHSMNLARFSHSNTLFTKRPSQKDKQEK